MSFNRFTLFVRHFNDGLFLDQRILDAMEPEFKEAYKELSKAIRENDKSDAVKYTYFKAVVDAMKQNDKEKVSNGLKAIQSQFASAEKKLTDTLSEATQKQAQAKQASDQAKAQLKAKQKLVAQFANVYKALDAITKSPKSASKLQTVIGKLGEFGSKLSSKSQALAFKASAGKDVSKEIASFRKAVDTEKKSADKAIATLTKESQKLDNAEKVQAEKVKLTKDKQLAFQKEKLDIANAGKALGAGKSATARAEKGNSELEKAQQEYDKALKEYEKAIEASDAIKKQIESKAVKMASAVDKYGEAKAVWMRKSPKAIWGCKESIDGLNVAGKGADAEKARSTASAIIKSAYKYKDFPEKAQELAAEVDKGRAILNRAGVDYGDAFDGIQRVIEEAKNVPDGELFGAKIHSVYNMFLGHSLLDDPMKFGRLYLKEEANKYINLEKERREKHRELRKAEGKLQKLKGGVPKPSTASLTPFQRELFGL